MKRRKGTIRTRLGSARLRLRLVTVTARPSRIAAKSEAGDAMAVALFNIFEDEIPMPRILLDKPYNGVRFVNCEGKLEGNILTLSELPPYGTAAFEVF